MNYRGTNNILTVITKKTFDYFAGENTSYVSELLRHAEELFDFAKNFKGRYHLSIKAAEKYYKSTSYKDELIWSAAWLYRATGKTKYLIWVSYFGDFIVSALLPNKKDFVIYKICYKKLRLINCTRRRKRNKKLFLLFFENRF